MIIAPKTEVIILDSNVDVVESGVTVWSSTPDFKAGDIVQINGTTHRKYKALQDNTDKSPLTDVNPTTGKGTYWYDIGATNYTKAFDELGSSKCVNVDSIYYKFQTSDIDVLMLGGLSASSVRIKVVNTDSSQTLMDETFETVDRPVFDWFDWTYTVAERQTSFFKIIQSMAYNSTLEIWITDTGLNAAVGHIAFGRSQSFGLTLADPKPTSSRRGVTTKSRDEFGEINTRRKARYKQMTITCLIDSDAVDIIEDRAERLVDRPCIFVGDESEGGHKALLIYGELKDHDMPISVSKTTYQLQVDGYI